MLRQLYIKNFTLIDELDITFDAGFSAITGETGAGKSIILGAIGLLLGNRADSKAVKTGTTKCTIEAHFDLTHYEMADFFKDNDIDYDASDCIIRRELTATGKSRAFINDTPVSLTLMRTLGEQLVDIHSQHQNLLLQKEDFQLNVIDIIANNSQERNDYQETFKAYKATERQLNELKEKIERTRENEDFMRFQFNELSSAGLSSGQQEELEQESSTLEHAEDIKSALYQTDDILNGDGIGVVERIRTAISACQGIESVYPAATELTSRLDAVHIELKDIASEVGSHVENIDFDPARLDNIHQQLDTIYSLEQKYHVTTIDELLAIMADLKRQLEHIDNGDEELTILQQEVDKLRAECSRKANTLSETRKKAATVVEHQMLQRLVPLGIPTVRFGVELTAKPLSTDGADKVQFLFSANTSTAMQPVSHVASGGEIARVMLSLKAMISGAVKLPTIIFDEIDTGVSGKIAQKMALIMQEMATHDRQVISITHLPQIAALGAAHYKVYKEETPQGTISHMQRLTNEQRIREIAQMLSGDNITDAAITNAKELLKFD